LGGDSNSLGKNKVGSRVMYTGGLWVEGDNTDSRNKRTKIFCHWLRKMCFIPLVLMVLPDGWF
jgi:hypothetical protein